ncbi:MATE family efflux transporter (plasmid) [Vibrio sp. HDW18]|uniref:MATE family efflux transporter n=1 Tax=Vibrio sp. HDW18 TaxID=2714948 RepID=UPI00140C2EBF|nr:MATE family efflux transporter [Vibrio sp. HDW18]QIL87112.1 MATE family efflux transporter [Vibrio sp. HDW18]
MLQFRDENQHLLAQTIKIGIPVALQSALVAILSLADVLMVSSFGTEATAAVGLASKWHFVAIMIMAGLSSASGILIAQFWGKNDRSAAKSITLLAIKSGALLLLPVSILFVAFSKPIFLLQTSDVDVIRLGSDYLWYASPVLLLTHLVIVFESTLRSTNNALTPLLIAVMTIAVNIILNYGLISGNWGMPALGVAGAALATTLARALQLIVFLAYFHYRQHWLKTTLPLKASRITLKRKYISLAIPAVANALLWAIGTLAYQMIFGHMGTLELAVYSTLGPFESLCYALFFGLSVACSVIIGQHLGRGNYPEARSTSLTFIKIFALLGVISTTILLAIQPWLLKLLALDNAQFLPLSQPGLTILSVVISLKMLNMVIINGILRAGGENTFCLRTDFIAMWLLGLPISAIAAFVLHWPFHYVYPLMIIEELVKLTLCWRRYRQYIWLRNLTEEKSS